MTPTLEMTRVFEKYGLTYVRDTTRDGEPPGRWQFRLEYRTASVGIGVQCTKRYNDTVVHVLLDETWQHAGVSYENIYDSDLQLEAAFEVASKSTVWKQMLNTAKTERVTVMGPTDSLDEMVGFAFELDALFARYGLRARNTIHATKDRPR